MTPLTVIITFASVAACAAAHSDFSDCATNLNTLEQALFETGDNLLQLNEVYFPANAATSRFIRVTYRFEDEIEHAQELDGPGNCSVSFIWAIGTYLFFQPPSAITYNSLLFNYPSNDLTDLILTLPSECRPLIQSEANGECTCTTRSRLLDLVTQQV